MALLTLWKLECVWSKMILRLLHVLFSLLPCQCVWQKQFFENNNSPLWRSPSHFMCFCSHTFGFLIVVRFLCDTVPTARLAFALLLCFGDTLATCSLLVVFCFGKRYQEHLEFSLVLCFDVTHFWVMLLTKTFWKLKNTTFLTHPTEFLRTHTNVSILTFTLFEKFLNSVLSENMQLYLSKIWLSFYIWD